MNSMIGDQIKGRMKENRLKQKELAIFLTENMGKSYSQPTVSLMLRDDQKISIEELKVISRFLNVSEVYFLGH